MNLKISIYFVFFLFVSCEQSLDFKESEKTQTASVEYAVNDAFYTVAPSTNLSFNIDGGNPPFKVDVYEERSLLKVSSHLINSLSSGITSPNISREYRARVTDAKGKVVWVDFNVNSGASSFPFAGTISFSNAGRAHWIESGDVNGNGSIDLMVSDAVNNRVRIYEGDNDNNGVFDGSYTLINTVAVSNYANFSTADLSADGDMDIIGLKSGGASEQICTYINDGSGNFSETCTNISIVPSSGSLDLLRVRTSFLNNDEYPDFIITGNANGNEVYFILSDASGTLASVQTYTISGALRLRNHLDIGDFNGDGILDFVLQDGNWNSSNGQRYIVYGDGQGGFSDHSSHTFSTAYGGGYLCLKDANHDGLVDILSHHVGDGFTTSSNNGDKTSTEDQRVSSSAFNSSPAAYSMRCADLDGDGNVDAYFPMHNRDYTYGNRMGAWYVNGNGDGTFVTSPAKIHSSATTGSWQSGVAGFIDANQDGILDVIMGSASNGNVSVILGN